MEVGLTPRCVLASLAGVGDAVHCGRAAVGRRTTRSGAASVPVAGLAAGAAAVRWAPRVPPHKIRRLYETDARGIVDAEQIDAVGFALYARCQSIVRVTEAHHGRVPCPRCGASVPRPEPVRVRRQVLRCAACGWATTWGAYFATYRGKQLKGGSAIGAFREFAERFPLAGTPRARMLAIDRLLHAFHDELIGPSRPAGVNLIEGSRSAVLDFLHTLTYGTGGEASLLNAPGRGVEQARRAAALARARLGDRLRGFRRTAGLAGTEVRARAGMSQRRIWEIETGRRTASVADVERLCRALGVPPDQAAAAVAEASALAAERPTLRRRPRQDRTVD